VFAWGTAYEAAAAQSQRPPEDYSCYCVFRRRRRRRRRRIYSYSMIL